MLVTDVDELLEQLVEPEWLIMSDLRNEDAEPKPLQLESRFTSDG